MLKNVLAGGISSASVLTLEPKDIKAVVVHYNLGASNEDEVRIAVESVEVVGWRRQVMGFIRTAAREKEVIYTEHGRSPVGGGRLIAGPEFGFDYDVIRRALNTKDPTLVFPLRLGRSSSLYASHAHVTLSKEGAALLAVWLDTLLEQS